MPAEAIELPLACDAHGDARCDCFCGHKSNEPQCNFSAAAIAKQQVLTRILPC